MTDSAQAVRDFLDRWSVAAHGSVIASVDTGKKVGEEIWPLTVSMLEDLIEQVEEAATRTYVNPGPDEEVFFYPKGGAAWCIVPDIPSVFLVWGDQHGTVSEYRDDTRDWNPGQTALQRKLMATRLRHIADRIDIQPGMLLMPEELTMPTPSDKIKDC